MPGETEVIEYQTVEIGAAYLVKSILQQLGVEAAIDQELKYQPEIATTYGRLAQVVIFNRMSLNPQPLYQLPDWVSRHGIDRLLGLQAAWLDDDRLGAMLDGLAAHQVAIWSTIIGHAVRAFKPDLAWLHSDTTSVYFEGRYEDDAGAPKMAKHAPVLVKGYNKDGKPQNVQFVLSLITSKRMPLWYQPWDGNQSDDGVYLADMTALRATGLLPENVVLIGDRKLCNQEAMLAFCRTNQCFLAAHPWTDTAKATWEETWQALQQGEQAWTPVEYVTRNAAHKPVEQRTQYRVCEVAHALVDAAHNTVYPLRWVFSWSSSKAELDARQRNKALVAGEQALQRIQGLLGKYDYKSRKVIESRLDKALRKAQASRYFGCTLHGTDEDQAWALRWARCPTVISQAERFDGIVLLCTTVPVERLAAGAVMTKYKEQVTVEQTIDFIKSPVQIRPMWLHAPRRLAGLTLLIMIAVLVAALLEYQIRRQIAQTGQVLNGLMPEHRDNPYPTAKKMLQAFQDYALVIVRHADGHEVIHYPKLRPVQQQIWDLMGLSPPGLTPIEG
jgi:transposase